MDYQQELFILMEEEHYHEAIELLEKEKRKGNNNEDVNYYLGVLYDELHEPQKALRYFYLSHTLGRDDGDINFRIGCILNLLGEFYDAITFLKDALAKGKDDAETNSELAYTLCRAHREKEGIDYYKKAISIIRKQLVSDRYNIDLISQVAYLYGQMKNYRKQLEYLQLARGQGRDDVWLMAQSANACFMLQEYRAAFQEYRLAARGDDVDSQFQLAKMYQEGLGTQKDGKQAVIWFRRAFENGHPKAAEELSMIFYSGDGVEVDKQEAFRWLALSRESNDPDSLCEVGKIYYTGQGVKKDIRKALSYFTKAADLNQKDAQFYLGRMYQEGEGVVRDEEKAHYWLKRSSDQGNTLARKMLEKDPNYKYSTAANERAMDEVAATIGVYDEHDEHLMKAIRLVKQKNYRSAVDEFMRVKNYDKNFNILKYLYTCYRHMGQNGQSYRYLGMACTMYDRSDKLMYEYASLALRQHDEKKCENILLKILERNPEFKPARRLLDEVSEIHS